MSSMRAVVYSEYGPPEALRVEQRPIPEPGPGELLIRVCAVEATKADCELRSFHFPVKWFLWPLRLAMGIKKPKREILGGYFSGVVEKRGEGAARFEVGDEIFGAAQFRFGAYGEYMVLPERFTLSKKPENVSFPEAAAVPLGGLNALHFMRKAEISPGERVLINGAGGSIGSFAVQIAKERGAHVTAVDAAHKEALVRQLGADEFIDYASTDFSQTGQKYDVIFDMVAASSYDACLSALEKGGRYLCGNPTMTKMIRSGVTSLLTSRKATFAFAGETQEELDTLSEMLKACKLRSPVDRVLPLEEAPEAHRRVETEQRRGAVVLSALSSSAC